MSIIIEGPDNVGKSTAAERLVEMLGRPWKRVHMSRPVDDFDYFSGYMEQLDDRTVHDRFHLGALVYGRLLGLHSTSISPRTFAVVERYIRWQGTLIVIMFDGNDDNYAQRLKKKEMFDTESCVYANMLFRILAWRGGHCHLWHDISKQGFPLDQTLETWITKMVEMQRV